MIDFFVNPMSWHAVAAAVCLMLGIYVAVTGSGGLLNKHFIGVSLLGLLWGVYFAFVFLPSGGFRLDSAPHRLGH